MAKLSRQKAISAYVEDNGPTAVTELADHFGISMSTIRRDIDELYAKQVLNKMYGCVTKNVQENNSVPLHSRSSIGASGKKIVAKIASRYVEDGDVIFIDSGSTTCYMVEFLQAKKNITIVTNNLDVVVRTIPFPNLQVYVLPGLLNRSNNSFSFLTNEELYTGYNIQKAFLSSSGISLKYGVSHNDMSERIVKSCAIETPLRYLMVDHTKFDKAAPLHLCDMSRFNTVFTDMCPAEEYVEYCRRHGVKLIYE